VGNVAPFSNILKREAGRKNRLLLGKDHDKSHSPGYVAANAVVLTGSSEGSATRKLTHHPASSGNLDGFRLGQRAVPKRRADMPWDGASPAAHSTFT
jgi:hypothetical protein